MNHECERFHLQTLTEDQFKCLIFIAGLHPPDDSEIRSRLLVKLETDEKVTVQDLTAEFNRLLKLRKDTMLVQQQPSIFSQPSQVSHIHSNKSKGSNKIPPSTCWSCSEWHYARFCPFKKHKCQVCHKRGHKENFCRPPNVQSPDHQTHCKSARKTYKKMNQRRKSHSVSAFKVDFKSRWKYISVGLNEIPVHFQFDTASDITLISRNTWTKIGKPDLLKTKHVAQSASGNDILLTGELNCSVSFRDKQFTGTCYVIDADLNLIGLERVEELDLFIVPLKSVFNTFSHKSVQDTEKYFTQMFKSKFSDVFREDLGCCKEIKATLKLKADSKPIFRPKCPVSYAVLNIVEKELDRLQEAGVIEPTNYSRWAAPIVIVRKANGKVHICADYSTGLNNALDAHQYPLPIPENLFAKLNGGICFAKIDFSDTFLQLEVDEDSKELLTINTHKGLFRYNRLPFGVKTAPSIFQQTMDAMLTGITGAIAFLDNIII